MNRLLHIALCMGLSLSIFGQNELSKKKSNIISFTPSKLLSKGQWDIKWFNNIYTETESTFSSGEQPRINFFTSSFDLFTGISKNSRINVGLLFEVRSNTIGGRDIFDVFSFDNDGVTGRSGLTSFAPAIKFNPIKNIGNLTIQSALHIPLVDQETKNGIFLDQNGFIWQNRLFYDKTLKGDKFQLFSELTTELNFGDEDKSFANNSLNVVPGLFFSYFPTNEFTVLVFGQHTHRLDLGNDFSQDFTAIGGGAKYQINDVLNVELLYSNFIRGSNTGLGQTYNLGLRALF